MLMELKQFFAMGGYAFYVWTAYGAAILILIINSFLTFKNHRRVVRNIKQWLKRK